MLGDSHCWACRPRFRFSVFGLVGVRSPCALFRSKRWSRAADSRRAVVALSGRASTLRAGEGNWCLEQ